MAVVRLSKVSKAYGSHQVLREVSFEVEKGRMLALIGRSGSGKSTLLRCMNGLEPIQGGEIEMAGRKVTQGTASLRALRQEVGMVFQQYNLFPHLTVERNVTLAPDVVKGVARDEARALARRVLAQVGLESKIDALPAQLSGGQQQRVAIARSLAMAPKVMLFDEVTSALDPELTGEVLKVMEELARGGMTMILVTHEMAFARRVADTVGFMHHGRLWEFGTPDEVMNKPATPELEGFLGAVL